MDSRELPFVRHRNWVLGRGHFVEPGPQETLEEHMARSTELLDDIFASDYGDFVVLTAHSGTIMSLFAATGWKKVPVAAGAVYPLFVCGETLP